MIIKWINHEAKEVPTVGFFKDGDVFECNDEMATDLIRQKLCAPVEPNGPKGTIKEKNNGLR